MKATITLYPANFFDSNADDDQGTHTRAYAEAVQEAVEEAFPDVDITTEIETGTNLRAVEVSIDADDEDAEDEENLQRRIDELKSEIEGIADVIWEEQAF